MYSFSFYCAVEDFCVFMDHFNHLHFAKVSLFYFGFHIYRPDIYNKSFLCKISPSIYLTFVTNNPHFIKKNCVLIKVCLFIGSYTPQVTLCTSLGGTWWLLSPWLWCWQSSALSINLLRSSGWWFPDSKFALSLLPKILYIEPFHFPPFINFLYYYYVLVVLSY
jgi:hypothetical protein